MLIRYRFYEQYHPPPQLRLAYTETGMKPSNRIKTAFGKPDVRLAWFDIPAVNHTLDNVHQPCAPIGPLAHKVDGQGDGCLTGIGGNEVPQPQLTEREAPALLVSYYYVEPFLKNREAYRYRDWMMDSGAYSAWNSGITIDLDKYIAFCHRLAAEDTRLSEIIALDVINDGKTPKATTAKQSLENAIKMKDSGLDVVPVFHYGEDFAILREYCQGFRKVGLSCRFGEQEEQSYRFYDQCFAREWPKKFHSFGWISDSVVFNYPFHSGDSTSWEAGPCAFGNWQKFGKMTVRGSNQDLRSQVYHYLDMEGKARVRWAKEMAQLETVEPNKPLHATCRLQVYPEPAAAEQFGKAKAKAKPAKAVEPAEKHAGELDNKWVDYWKQRL